MDKKVYSTQASTDIKNLILVETKSGEKSTCTKNWSTVFAKKVFLNVIFKALRKQLLRRPLMSTFNIFYISCIQLTIKKGTILQFLKIEFTFVWWHHNWHFAICIRLCFFFELFGALQQLANFFLSEIMLVIESHDNPLTIKRGGKSSALTLKIFISSLSSHS